MSIYGPSDVTITGTKENVLKFLKRIPDDGVEIKDGTHFFGTTHETNISNATDVVECQFFGASPTEERDVCIFVNFQTTGRRCLCEHVPDGFVNLEHATEEDQVDVTIITIDSNYHEVEQIRVNRYGFKSFLLPLE